MRVDESILVNFIFIKSITWLMNFIILFCDPVDTVLSLVGSFQTIHIVNGKDYCHYEIHSVMLFSRYFFSEDMLEDLKKLKE